MMQLDITQALQETDQAPIDLKRGLQVNQMAGIINDVAKAIFWTGLFKYRHNPVPGSSHDQRRDGI